MKKIWIALIAVAVMLAVCLLAGCSSDEATNDTSNGALSDSASFDAESVLQNESGADSEASIDAASDMSNEGDSLSGSESSIVSGVSSVESKPIETSKPTETSKPGETSKPSETSKPAEASKPSETSKPTETSKPAETSKPTETSKPAETSKPGETSKPSETSKPAETSKPTETSKPSETSKPVEKEEPEYGTEEWDRQVAEWTVYYINVLRAKEGKGELKVLPRMTEYAQQRAPMLKRNMNHKPEKMAEAATAIQYGMQIDDPNNAWLVEHDWVPVSLVGKGMYYPYGVGEAVGAGNSITQEEAMELFGEVKTGVAASGQGFAYAVYLSKEHWAYVGDAAYDDPELEHKWIGIGTYRNYICICVATDVVLTYENN